MGCSSIYTERYFSSKEKFYKDFNKSAFNKTLKVTLKNDSSFICSNGAEIKYDTLFLPFYKRYNNKNFIPLKNVKQISFVNHWKGIPIPLICGTIIGFGTGYLINNSLTAPGSNSDNVNIGAYGIIVLTGVGIISGGIIGWINGYTFTYQFNQ